MLIGSVHTWPAELSRRWLHSAYSIEWLADALPRVRESRSLSAVHVLPDAAFRMVYAFAIFFGDGAEDGLRWLRRAGAAPKDGLHAYAFLPPARCSFMRIN